MDNRGEEYEGRQTWEKKDIMKSKNSSFERKSGLNSDPDLFITKQHVLLKLKRKKRKKKVV